MARASTRLFQALLGLAAFSVPVRAATLVALQSEPGDPINHGYNSEVTTDAATFEATYDPSSNAITITTTDANRSTLSMRFQPRYGETLVGTTQVMAERAQGSQHAAVSVRTNLEPCGTAEGMFIVYEFAATGNAIDRLAMDFQQRCTGATGVLRGEIRINTTRPATPPAPGTARARRRAARGRQLRRR
jgi:hypothetical protein